MNQDVIYDCISALSISEALDLTDSVNPCVAYLANLNINNRISDSKSSALYSNASARANKRVKVKKRGSKLRNGD